MRFLLYLLWSVLSLLVISLVGVTLLLTVYHEPLEEKLIGGIERVTGRNVDIAGGFGFGFSPKPTFTIRDIRMANADWGSRPWMLEIESLKASVSLLGLLRGQVQLEDIEGMRPRVLVEKDPLSGEHNWFFDIKKPPKPFAWVADNVKLENALVQDTRVEIEMGAIPHLLELDVVTGQSDFFSGLANIQAVGQLDQQPLELEIRLETLRSMFLRQPTRVRFEGNHGLTRIGGTGEIRELMRWRGHDITLDVAVPSLKVLQSWFQTRLIDTPALSGRAQFVQPQKWASARFEEIEVGSDALDGKTRITGRVEQLRGMNGIDLVGHLKYPLVSIMHWKQLESSTDIQIDAKVTLNGDRDSALSFNVQEALLFGEGVDIRGSGTVAHLLKRDTEGILFKGEIDNLFHAGLINDKRWFNTGPISGTFELAKQNGKLALQQIDLAAFDGRARLTGGLDDITAEQVGLFELQADLTESDVADINKLNEARLPVFRQSELSGQIDMRRTDFSARGVSLVLNSAGLTLRGQGDIEDLKNLHLEETEIALEADSIAHINRQFEIELPELGRMKAHGKAYGDLDSQYNINLLEAILDSNYQNIKGAGRLQRLGPDMTARLELSTSIFSASNIPPMFDSELRVPNKLLGTGTALLTAQGVRNWSLTEIDLNFEGDNQGTIAGSVVNFPLAPGFSLVADFDRYLATGLPEHEMIETLRPENIRAYVHVNKKPENDHFSFENIDAHFSLASGVAAVNMVGTIGNINEFSELALQLGFRTDNIHAVPYFSSIPMNEDMSGIATVWLSGTAEALGISLINAHIGDTDMRGELLLVREEGSKPKLSGRLASENLDLLALLAQEPRTRLFSSEIFDFDWLNDFNADLELRAARFNGEISEVNDAEIVLKVQDGILNMPNMNGMVGEDGRMVAWITIVGTSKPYSIVTSLKAEQVKSQHINLFGDSGFILGGRVDIDVGLGGAGMSVADYMGNAYGKIQLQLTDSSLKHRNLKLFGGDLISGVLNIIDTLDTLQNKAVYMPIECGVIHFPIIDGQAIASQGIAIKTEKTTVLGGGIIDLDSEELELLITPKARKGLGISAGTVANIVKVSGKIGDTRIAVDTSGLIQSSAAIGAAVVSGGWTLLLQGLADRNKANSDVCRQTLEEPNASFFQRSDAAESSFNEPHTER